MLVTIYFDRILHIKNRCVAYLASKYGKIDWLESNNEYWLELDAKLRTDFNINTGMKEDIIKIFKTKSGMKAYYKKAGVKTARYHLVENLAFTGNCFTTLLPSLTSSSGIFLNE